MKKRNLFYAQSGGVTPVINATACGVIETARQHRDQIGKVLAGQNGILGALNECLIDTSKESAKAIRALRHTPAGAFGSCRYKLKSIAENRVEYEQLIKVFVAHNVGYFLYNGGGDSQDTTHKLYQFSQQVGYPLTCIGIPKTIDNDLPVTDNCPGFGSVAKYIAISIYEAGLDVAAMAANSTKIFILEVMGRHTGWIAAASGLATQTEEAAPHIILFPEVAFAPEKFYRKVEQCVKKFGFCAIVVAEGLRDQQGKFLAESGIQDAFGHTQLGGAAPTLAHMIKAKLGYKYHWAVADYLQRAARHIASKIDVEQAYAVGQAAIKFALAGKNDVMPMIIRQSNTPYRWKIGEVKLAQVANQEKHLPRNFINREGFHITLACRQYLHPLIKGEDYPPYHQGLPQYIRLKNVLVPQQLTC